MNLFSLHDTLTLNTE